MANKRLTDDVIAIRMVEWRNLKTLHARDREQIAQLKTENNALKTENAELQQAVATLQIQIAELQTMVFGKKKRPPAGGTPAVLPELFAAPKRPRSKASYRRPIPPASAITSTEYHPVDACHTCGGELENVTTQDRYEEDIPLPDLTPNYHSHLVTKFRIERGVCTRCGKATSGKDLGGQTTRLGPNVRLLVCHLVSVGGMSYAGTTDLLLSLYGIAISSGEVAGILYAQSIRWHPAYEQLGADIRAAPVKHADETPWAIQRLQGRGYAWEMSDAGSQKVYFAMENSRGAIHAKKLFGEATDHPSVGVRISDDYAAYRSESLPGEQQLCWVHLYRAIRDLRYNAQLPKGRLPFVSRWYTSFAGIYKDVRISLTKPYDVTQRTAQSDVLWLRIQTLCGRVAPQKAGEPDKLTRLKAQLLRAGQDKLFTCLTKDTPCDNNRAERDLRQLVLKRKRSFGSQTERGAKALATVLSLCTTTWRTAPDRYFQALAGLG